MKNITIALLSLLAVSCAGMHGHDHEVEWVDYGDNPMMNPDYMAAMAAAGAPGEEHAELAKGVGTFDVDMKWWAGPGGDPMPMTAVANVEMIFGGRYMVEHFHGSMMGESFEGRLLMGYDNLAEEYFSLWIDDMSTSRGMMTGNKDEDGVLHMSGWMRDPMTPGGRMWRMEAEVGGGDTFVNRFYDTLPDGGEYKSMEMIYKRR